MAGRLHRAINHSRKRRGRASCFINFWFTVAIGIVRFEQRYRIWRRLFRVACRLVWIKCPVSIAAIKLSSYQRRKEQQRTAWVKHRTQFRVESLRMAQPSTAPKTLSKKNDSPRTQLLPPNGSRIENLKQQLARKTARCSWRLQCNKQQIFANHKY